MIKNQIILCILINKNVLNQNIIKLQSIIAFFTKIFDKIKKMCTIFFGSNEYNGNKLFIINEITNSIV